MPEQMPKPNVQNLVRVGDFKLYVYAYRNLTQAELRHCAYQWLRETKKTKFPAAGEAKMFTTIGFDQ